MEKRQKKKRRKKTEQQRAEEQFIYLPPFYRSQGHTLLLGLPIFSFSCLDRRSTGSLEPPRNVLVPRSVQYIDLQNIFYIPSLSTTVIKHMAIQYVFCVYLPHLPRTPHVACRCGL